jgi:hypothetical protein
VSRLRWASLLLLSACVIAPSDPFDEAESARRRGDLASALLAYDHVPVQHPRYPEARSAATAVERRMRRSHELLLQGMLLRSEWNDVEAMAAFQEAQAVWPEVPGVAELVQATRSRMQVFRAPGIRAPGRDPVAAGGLVRPVPQSGAAPAGETATPAAGAPLPPVGQASAGSGANTGPAGEDSLAARLASLEGRMLQGQVDSAMADLIFLQNQSPRDPRLRWRLARLLHQRALLHYGQGAVPVALSDWRRALELCPDWQELRPLIATVESEHARNPRQ